SLVDIKQEFLDRAITTISKNLDRQVSKGSITEDDKKTALGRILTFTDLEAGVKSADLVVEAATETVDIKLDLFRQLDQFTPEKAILASNTSSISITKIAAVTKRPEQV